MPGEVAPLLKVTVPVGVGPPELATTAVRVTLCPKFDGFKLELRELAVGYLLTTSFTVPVLVLKVPSPTYAALMVCVAAVSADVLNTATPGPRRRIPSLSHRRKSDGFAVGDRALPQGNFGGEGHDCPTKRGCPM